jgi:hypothetical protein
MTKAWVRALAATAMLVAPSARAADHRDGPAAKAAPEADITDVYAWMSADASKMYLILNVSPAATTASKFSDKVSYVLHLNSQSAYGETDPTKISHVNLICQFDASATQQISCWLGPAAAGGIGTPTDYVTGDASATTGLTSQNGKFKVFAGLRDDPFFFNLDGFNNVVAEVVAAAKAPTFQTIVDASGCPHLPAATASKLAGDLAKDANGGPAKDFFAKLNVLSIVVAVNTADVTPGGKIVGVWGSTHKR